jgi:methionine-gamma-lyase
MENKPSQRMRDVQFFGEEGGVVPSIDVSATSTFLNPADMEKAFRGEISGCYLYSRHSNPTVKAFGTKMAAMENTESALGLASGMSAIYSAIRQLMPEGGHIVSSRTVYGGTWALFQNILPKIGIKVTWVDTGDLKSVERAITKETKILYAETMSNPLLAVADLPKLSEITRKHKVTFVVDNTFTPLIVAPARFGADVVLHSCTKFISGASDLMAGAICGRREFIDQLIDVNNGIVMLTGPVMDANVAHRLYERLDHLASRIVSHSKSAMHLAKEMSQAKIPVIYPGLETHPDRELLSGMMNRQYGFGGMMTVECGSPERALALAHELQQEKFGLYAVSLGFSRTLMSCPSISTSSEIPEEEQKKMGLSKGLLRLSIGYSGDDEVMAERFLRGYKKICGR